jgi:hypothetical protein
MTPGQHCGFNAIRIAYRSTKNDSVAQDCKAHRPKASCAMDRKHTRRAKMMHDAYRIQPTTRHARPSLLSGFPHLRA